MDGRNPRARSGTGSGGYPRAGAALGVIGALVGLAPHVLHHIGLLARTTLSAGAAGSVVFGVVGLVASVPLLL